jgi:hypothetical protein
MIKFKFNIKIKINKKFNLKLKFKIKLKNRFIRFIIIIMGQGEILIENIKLFIFINIYYLNLKE